MAKDKQLPVRVVSIPVAEVLSENFGSKKEFYESLRRSLSLARRMSNAAATDCLRQDDLIEQKSKAPYTYPAIKHLAPAGQATVAAAISRNVSSHHARNRYLIVEGKRASQSFRHIPWPLLRSQRFSVEDRGEFLVAKIRLADGFWAVRLRGGSNYRDQIKAIRNAIADNSIRDSSIRVDQKGRAILSVACRIPVRSDANLSGTMCVDSHRDSLLYLSFDRSAVPFVVNADEAKQWKAEARRRCRRLKQDKKSGCDRRRINAEMCRISSKMQNRMNTLCHQAASQVVKKARVKRIATIQLDFTIKSYASEFPWYALAQKIKEKAEIEGIEVRDVTEKVVKADVNKPHIYFKLAPISGRIKIGRTAQIDGKRHSNSQHTVSPEHLVIIAVWACDEKDLVRLEKRFHAMFSQYRNRAGISPNRLGTENGEWFLREPVLDWLRERRLFGNAGNLSEIKQVMEVPRGTLHEGHLRADGECSLIEHFNGCSQNAVKGEDFVEQSTTALAVTDFANGS